MATCFVVGAAAYCRPFTPGADDFVIAADGGLAHLRAAGITPDMVLGDFDSLADPPQGAHVQTFPVEKDDTDVMLALKLGFARGWRSFRILGGTGGRTDHTLANLQALLWLAARGAHGVLCGEGECFTVIREGEVRFRAGMSGGLSVFAMGGPAAGVTLTGLHYPLENGTLQPDFPLGVSNRFESGSAAVRVEKGALLIMWQGDPGDAEFT